MSIEIITRVNGIPDRLRMGLNKIRTSARDKIKYFSQSKIGMYGNDN